MFLSIMRQENQKSIHLHYHSALIHLRERFSSLAASVPPYSEVVKPEQLQSNFVPVFGHL